MKNLTPGFSVVPLPSRDKSQVSQRNRNSALSKPKVAGNSIFETVPLPDVKTLVKGIGMQTAAEVISSKTGKEVTPEQLAAIINQSKEVMNKFRKKKPVDSEFDRPSKPQSDPGWGSLDNIRKDFTLSSPIQPHAIATDYMLPESGICAPLHMSALELDIPADSSQGLGEYFDKVIYPKLVEVIQTNITWGLDINVFSLPNVRTYFTNVIKAVSIYSYYASIVGYNLSETNQNRGMVYMRSNISVTDIERLDLLKSILQSVPVPPRFYEMIRWLYDTYECGHGPGSALLKFSPHTITATGVDVDEINAAINLINGSTAQVKLANIMRRACKSWIIPDYSFYQEGARADKQWLNVWANCPYIIRRVNVNYHYPLYDGGEIFYNSYQDYYTTDGCLAAFTGAFITDGDYLPGLVNVPMDTELNGNSSRKSYYEVSGVDQFYAAWDDDFLNYSRGETYRSKDVINLADEGVQTPHHLFGTQVVHGITPFYTGKVAEQYLYYLMSFDTIKGNLRKG